MAVTLSQITSGSCFLVDPTSTPIPPSRTPIIIIITPKATRTPTITLPTRSQWPSPTPMASSTPTATAALYTNCWSQCCHCFCREYRHKSSEGTVDDNEINANLSGLDDKSYSSETDPLNLNTSSDVL